MYTKEICLYGGSFNPSGLHHLEIVKHLLTRFKQVAVIPCGMRPDKKSVNFIEPRHRQTMAKLMFGQLADRGVTFDFSDINNSEFTRTWELQERYGIYQKIWHCVGYDLVAGGSLGKSQIQTQWAHGEEIWSAVNFFVIASSFSDFDRRDLPPHSQLITLDLNGRSFYIRDAIKKGESFEQMVTPEVAAYIKKNQLYSWKG
ncbi:MAG: hypothetical protein Q8Q23_02475 [bacterium]|nr:hypothetical protein [bacterium]